MIVSECVYIALFEKYVGDRALAAATDFELMQLAISGYSGTPELPSS